MTFPLKCPRFEVSRLRRQQIWPQVGAPRLSPSIKKLAVPGLEIHADAKALECPSLMLWTAPSPASRSANILQPLQSGDSLLMARTGRSRLRPSSERTSRRSRPPDLPAGGGPCLKRHGPVMRCWENRLVRVPGQKYTEDYLVITPGENAIKTTTD